MEIVFDPTKDEANRTKHGISLARAGDMRISVFVEDDRFDYGERRYRAYGFIDEKAYVLVFAERAGQIRAISLRRAHIREMRRHVE